MGTETTYRDAGVDIDAGNRAVALMKDAVAATQGPEVLAGVGHSVACSVCLDSLE